MNKFLLSLIITILLSGLICADTMTEEQQKALKIAGSVNADITNGKITIKGGTLENLDTQTATIEKVTVLGQEVEQIDGATFDGTTFRGTAKSNCMIAGKTVSAGSKISLTSDGQLTCESACKIGEGKRVVDISGGTGSYKNGQLTVGTKKYNLPDDAVEVKIDGEKTTLFIPQDSSIGLDIDGKKYNVGMPYGPKDKKLEIVIVEDISTTPIDKNRLMIIIGKESGKTIINGNIPSETIYRDSNTRLKVGYNSEISEETEVKNYEAIFSYNTEAQKDLYVSRYRSRRTDVIYRFEDINVESDVTSSYDRTTKNVIRTYESPGFWSTLMAEREEGYFTESNYDAWSDWWNGK